MSINIPIAQPVISSKIVSPIIKLNWFNIRFSSQRVITSKDLNILHSCNTRSIGYKHYQYFDHNPINKRIPITNVDGYYARVEPDPYE